MSLCYCLTEEFKQEQVRLEQERLRKKVLLDKTASTITHDQQEFCYKAIENFAYRKWSIAMVKVLFSIKWREKLA